VTAGSFSVRLNGLDLSGLAAPLVCAAAARLPTCAGHGRVPNLTHREDQPGAIARARDRSDSADHENFLPAARAYGSFLPPTQSRTRPRREATYHRD